MDDDDDIIDANYVDDLEDSYEEACREINHLHRAIGELCDANVPIIDFCRSRGVVVGVNGIVADLLKATEPTP